MDDSEAVGVADPRVGVAPVAASDAAGDGECVTAAGTEGEIVAEGDGVGPATTTFEDPEPPTRAMAITRTAAAPVMMSERTQRR